MADNVQVFFFDGKWEVKVAGQKEPASTHDSQEEAVEEGKRLAREKGWELLVHGEGGGIESRESFGGGEGGGETESETEGENAGAAADSGG